MRQVQGGQKKNAPEKKGQPEPRIKTGREETMKKTKRERALEAGFL